MWRIHKEKGGGDPIRDCFRSNQTPADQITEFTPYVRTYIQGTM